MNTMKSEAMRLKSLHACIPLLAFTFFGALFEDRAPLLVRWFIASGFAVACAWVIYHIRSRKLYSTLLPATLVGVLLALALGAVANRFFFHE